jgi:demethylmenaquinone methyltransferase/2-methoxy-6-polyprenyl-1,4-benzoquinol methylase
MSAIDSDRARHARRLFAGIAPEYGWMGAALSFGQDVRWRRFLVRRLEPIEGLSVLDVASGTGLVARELARRGARVVGLDPSEPMVLAGRRVTERRGLADRVVPVLGVAEALPFTDGAFDALTVTYLLRYVDDPAATIRELVRVVRPGGVVASLEFAVPPAAWARWLWRVYTRRVMPLAGRLVSPAWETTGRFLGPSIEAFERANPQAILLGWWRDAGLAEVRARRLSNGAAVVVWGRRR